MFNYILRRLLLLIPTLLGATLVVFTVMAASPGGVGGTEMNDEGSVNGEQAKAAMEYRIKRFGLDKPLPVQYWRWLNHVSPVGFESNESDGSLGKFQWWKTPDLGRSFSKGRPVVDLVAESLPITLLLNLLTLPITHTIAIGSGIYSAKRRGGLVDVSTGMTFLALWSVPVILAGVMAIGFLANRQYIHLFPTGGLHDLQADSMRFLPSHDAAGWNRGYLLDTIWHLILPVACLSYGGFAFLSKMVRGSMLENLSADYARTARAKGLRENLVLFRHVFRNSLLPLITSSAGLIPGLLGGSLIVESIFSIHGMGFLMLEAVKAHDRELVMDQALVVGGIGLVSYLIADILYVVADPRVTFE
jgi:ABC-type dipeptide/oligopeptide/nickel transport system permease component